jgi:SAM-dependent methyltransferase
VGGVVRDAAVASPEKRAAVIAWEEQDNVRFTRQYTAPLLARLIGPPSAKGSVLSVGCGVGIDVDVLVDLGWDAYGIEPGYRAEAWARRRHRDRLKAVDGRALPWEDGRFDAATSYGVIEHVGAVGDSVEVQDDVWQARVDFAREVARVVRPGGSIVLSTPNRLFPIDFFHGTDRFGLRWHSPKERFTLSFDDMRRLFVDEAGCRSITSISQDRAFVFARSKTHLWGRMLAAPTRAVLARTGTRALAPLARTPVMPFLIVRIER